MMKLEEIKTDINLKDYADRNLKRGAGNFYYCPVCGETHHKATLALDGNLFKCFYGTCDAGGSVIDLIMITENKDATEAIRRARELYDPTFDPYWTPPKKSPGQKTTAQKPKQDATPKQEGDNNTMSEQKEIVRDFRNYYKHCQKRISDTKYPQERGLNEAIVKQFGLGFDPEWISPTAEYKRKQENAEIEKENKRLERDGQPLLPLKPPLTPSPRLIIPVGKNNYLARDTRPDSSLTDYQKQFKKMNEGKDKPIFNLEAIYNPAYFIIVEGEIDCLSILQAGGNCLALGSTTRAGKLGEILKQRDAMETGIVVIALDNDTAGQKATETIITACEIAGHDFITANASGQYKDPNDYLVHDPQGFYDNIQAIVTGVKAERLADYQDGNADHAVKRFMERPLTAGKSIPTGFKKIDAFLNGGLTPGLILLGGLSSLGKTTLALQIAEHIATNTYPQDTQGVIRGRDVLYFALEQSETALISKLLSRRTYIASERKKKGEKLAKTNIQLLRRDSWTDWPQDDWDNLWECYKEFQRDVKGNLRFVESAGDLTAMDIVKITKRHIAITGRIPVIFVDYLQILKPIDERATDKQAVDRTLTTLYRLARDYETVIFGISSFNRENYWQEVNLTSFKDTGNLEYSAEMMFAISPAGMKNASTEEERKENKELVEKTKESKERRLQFHVLKTRSGKITGRKNKLYLNYKAMFNCFEEMDAPSDLDPFDNGNPQVKTKIVKKF